LYSIIEYKHIFMKKYFVILFVLCINSIILFGQTPDHQLNASQKAYILSRFCTEVKYNFVYYDKLPFDWDSLCVASMPSLTQTTTDDDFIAGMKHLCSQLHDGHTYIYSKNNAAKSEDWIQPFPMKTKRVADRVFVTAVYSSAFKAKGLSAGCEVLSIDGEPVLDYAAKHIQPFFSYSTPQWYAHAPFGEYELTKAKGSKVSSIVFRNLQGKTFTITSHRNIDWDISNRGSALEYKVVEKNIGLLTIHSFQAGEFSNSEFDRLYKELYHTDALIIDLRDNGGGNSSYADYVIRHFLRQKLQGGRWDTPMYIAAHASWHYPSEWFAESGDELTPYNSDSIYRKPVVLLVNAGTFSSAEDFCVAFRGGKCGKIIGSLTGGSTGNPIVLPLGYGLYCKICTRHELQTDGTEFVGIGIRPDIEVEETPEMFTKKKDRVIEAGVEQIENGK
jgi:carboxyl-terminal processing protease